MTFFLFFLLGCFKRSIKKRLAIFNGKLGQNSDCMHAITVQGNTMPEASSHATPVFKPFVTGLMPHSGPCFCTNQVAGTFIWKVNNLRLASITLISLGSFACFKQQLLQSTQSKDCDVNISACPPWPIGPHNISTLNGDADFISDGRLLKLVRNPATAGVTIVWRLAQKISAVNRDFLWKACILPEPIIPLDLETIEKELDKAY